MSVSVCVCAGVCMSVCVCVCVRICVCVWFVIVSHCIISVIHWIYVRLCVIRVFICVCVRAFWSYM